ncbi:MAG: hypothetical protein IOC54_14335 [Methylobacterium sp.]|nr:hypothetical protein [Methylobacterium sp.]
MSGHLINTGTPSVHSGSGWAVPGTQPGTPRHPLAVSMVEAALSSPTHRETRQADGQWPYPRAEMRSARRIRERICEDAARLLRARGREAVLTTEDFLRLGWRRAQLAEHGAAAIANLSSENACGNDTRSPEVA